MSQFEAKKLDLNNINSKNRYKNGDGVQAETINAVVEGVAYVQDALENQGGGGTPTDVQINGVSITENGVANIPIADGVTVGAIKLGAGLKKEGTDTVIDKASDDMITAGTDIYRPIVSASVDLAVKKGLTANGITLTDDEKAVALAWLGMVLDKGTSTNANNIVKRYSGGNIFVPSVPSYNDAATSKYYVDNLPTYLTLTDEQKAKWKTWIEGMGISGGSGSQLYLHQVPIHFTGYGSVAPEFTLILNVLSSQSTAYGSETSFETLVNTTFNKTMSVSFVSDEIQFKSSLPLIFFIEGEAFGLRYLQTVTSTEYTIQGPVNYTESGVFYGLEINEYTPTQL